MAASALTGLYRGPRNLNLAVVLRFAVDAVSVQRAQMALAGKESGKNLGQWFRPSTAAGLIKCVDVAVVVAYMLTFLPDCWCKVSHKHRSASRSLSTARSYKQTCNRRQIRHPTSSSLQAIRDEEGARSLSCSSVFGFEQTESITRQ